MSNRLAALRNQLAAHGICAYVQPVADEFLSEYPPSCFQRVQYLCGFCGSAGMLVVTADKAALFVDGRYTLQAANETDNTLFEVYNSGDITAEAWLAKHCAGEKIGYDDALFTPAALARFKNPVVVVPNLVDAGWQDRPAIPATKAFVHEDKYAGESSASKCSRLAEKLKEQGADAAFIAAPDSLCWLLNIRGRDVECTPLFLARALLYADGTVDVLVDATRLPTLPAHIRASGKLPDLARKRVLVDESATPVAAIAALEKAGAIIVKGVDPCILPKACKNMVQLVGIRAAHRRDGVAVSKLLHWIKTHNDIYSVSEMDIAGKLLAFRQENELFVEPSFPTIAGAGEHGAIVHYRATEKTSRTLRDGELLLLDSGGQYLDGTTDITRTIAIGAPSTEHKDRFTRVLKGHIALATALFPYGTRGSQLDALARQYLWQAGLDYDHGTGHGVGQFLGVHEGPQRISKRAGDAVLEAGMILSNEPGYYKTGEYGIRIENLVVVVEKEHGFLGFETLTCVPLDEKLVDFSMLSEAEKAWLDDYQAWAHQGA